ncbi:uncharacterized protein LOC119556236 [Drosophila subpulchrella]|uniref:uncharacterized protein LOC119556236 n=1 Tax=Drosophila subpulchrella TaxID=1486046 RepID=UPI0018A1ACC7|nr:uncharacterized protein LOC119556236 [Drosophila subpulchrella]
MDEEVMAIGGGPPDPLIINADKIVPKDASVDVFAKPFIRVTQPGSVSGEADILQKTEAEWRLISLVRRQPALYDARHPKFHDDVHREKLWQGVANRLATDLTNCLAAWAELRYRYQRHVRRLRAFQRNRKGTKGQRPCMRHEEELLFLYPHVARFPLTVEKIQPAEVGEPTEVIEENETLPDVEIVEPPPVDIIDVDLEDEAGFQFRLTDDQRRLIEAVQAYPQLYNCLAPGYENTRHRGLIWGAIANELHDKATKLMKSWLNIQTRYEWELTQRPDKCSNSELCKLMEFLRPHVLRLRNTVCKASKYLQNGWYEPIENFRSVMSLINTMRNMPDLVQLTDESMAYKVKPPRYDEFWQKVGIEVVGSHERCEVTWLMLRSFHHELQAMRSAGYQLQDKWYFENALSSIFKQVAARTTARQSYKRKHNGAISMPGEPAPKISLPTLPTPPRLPLAIVYPPASKTSSSISSSNSASGTNTGMLPTITNVRSCSGPVITNSTSNAAPTSVSSSVASDPSVPTFMIPKITSAMSVATGNIVPLKLPPTLRIAPKAAAAMGMGLPAGPANIQLSGANITPVRPTLPQRPGLQVSIQTKQPIPNPPQMPSAASRSLIRQNMPAQRTVGITVQRYPPATALGTLLSEPPLTPQIPPPILQPAPASQHLPTLVPIKSSNIVTNSGQLSGTGAPMVRIHQSGLLSGWDANNKPMGSLAAPSVPTVAAATTTTTISANASAATSKWSSVSPLPDYAKKHGQVAQPLIRISNKPAAESALLPSVPAVQTISTGSRISTGAIIGKGATISTPATLSAGATIIKGGTISTGATLSTGATISPIRAAASSAPSAVKAKAATLLTSTTPGSTATQARAATLATTATVDITNADDTSETISTVSSSATVFTAPPVANAQPKAIQKTVSNAKTAVNETATAVCQPEKETTTLSSNSQLENDTKDITVVLHENPATGNNMLHILCDNQATRYNLNMVRTATLIREVMAVPQLHKKDPQLAAKCDEFWKLIGKKFHMPEDALRAVWKFLAENISVFPLIAPMSELMRPFKASVKVWEKSHRLFSKFDEIARKYLWMEHKDVLPDVIRHFRHHEHLYWELRKARPGEEVVAPRQYTDQERQEVWREARIKFPNLNHRDVWSMFKFAFRTYMEDLERGIENPWPQNWWQALEQLRFLADVRYHPLEPYYYIVHNKIAEEVKRCSMYEALMSADPADKKKPTPAALLARLAKEPMPWESEEAKRLLTGKLSVSQSVYTKKNIAAAPIPPAAAPPIPVPGGTPVPTKTPAAESNAVTKAPSDGVEVQQRNGSAQKRLPQMKRVAGHLPTIEAFELTHVLRRHPHTFERASTIDKRTAWVRVSKELNATVTECRLGLQYALREMRYLKITDPMHRCAMGHKYFRHMSEIYKQVKPNGPLTVRTPQQLNQSLTEPAQEVEPQRFVPEINLTTCSPGLVLKNWAKAVGNLSPASQDILLGKLTQLFAKYAEEANVTWVYPAPP